MTIEVEIEVTQPEAKKCRQLLEAGRDEEQILLELAEGISLANAFSSL